MPPELLSLGALVERILSIRPGLGPVRLVCVDGPAGSGKTTLANRLASRLPDAVVVHLDDLYEGWAGLEGVWERVEAQILRPLSAGRSTRYEVYDWELRAFTGAVDLDVPEVLILEGCGSAPRAVDGRAALRIWVEAPPSVRLARGLARDGEELRDNWLSWMGREAAHFATEHTRERADLRVDGSPALVHPDEQIVLLQR